MALWADHDLRTRWLADCGRSEIVPDEAQMGQFERFYDILVEANQTMNLTRITDEAGFLYRHLLDSLVLAPLLGPRARLVDVGSGAGFPSIPLAILRPDVRIMAVDATGKKARFIESVRDALELENLSVMNARSEEIARDPRYREQFDQATARAVAALPSLLELVFPLLKTGGLFLAMKGESVEEELKAAKKAMHVLHGNLKETRCFPQEELSRSRLLVIRKTGGIPDLYPRGGGAPLKKPLS